jgi:hypothetical protein
MVMYKIKIKGGKGIKSSENKKPKMGSNNYPKIKRLKLNEK